MMAVTDMGSKSKMDVVEEAKDVDSSAPPVEGEPEIEASQDIDSTAKSESLEVAQQDSSSYAIPLDPESQEVEKPEISPDVVPDEKVDPAASSAPVALPDAAANLITSVGGDEEDVAVATSGVTKSAGGDGATLVLNAIPPVLPVSYGDVYSIENPPVLI
jgi:hypothetical protein